MTDDTDASRPFERALAARDTDSYVFKLYVAGMTPRSQRAIATLRRLTSDLDRCEVEVIDVYQHPGVLRERQIVALPTLVRELPVPRRRFIGDLSHVDAIARTLGVEPLQT